MEEYLKNFSCSLILLFILIFIIPKLNNIFEISLLFCGSCLLASSCYCCFLLLLVICPWAKYFHFSGKLYYFIIQFEDIFGYCLNWLCPFSEQLDVMLFEFIYLSFYILIAFSYFQSLFNNI